MFFEFCCPAAGMDIFYSGRKKVIFKKIIEIWRPTWGQIIAKVTLKIFVGFVSDTKKISFFRYFFIRLQ